MASPLRKILIANRGEIALRVMRTCREMRIGSVAVYSEADRLAPHVSAADEAYCIGPAPSRESYLRIDAIIDTARRSGADAIHPGYGFLSENAEFARRVRDAGLVFIGPRAESIAAMGDKTAARALVRAAGVPTVPGTDGAVRDIREAEEFCRRFGYPVLLKAAAGGGGKGMRVVRNAADLSPFFLAASSEARSAFGDDRVYVEKYLDDPRHIEFQIFADRAGNTVHMGERECSIQRRHQKVIEETPSVLLDETMRRTMGDTAISAARACGYENAGTIEFLVDRNRNFYFLEMNTRLQVEHPVTELRTGLDLVALQIAVASGELLPFRQEELSFRGPRDRVPDLRRGRGEQLSPVDRPHRPPPDTCGAGHPGGQGRERGGRGLPLLRSDDREARGVGDGPAGSDRPDAARPPGVRAAGRCVEHSPLHLRHGTPGFRCREFHDALSRAEVRCACPPTRRCRDGRGRRRGERAPGGWNTAREDDGDRRGRSRRRALAPPAGRGDAQPMRRTYLVTLGSDEYSVSIHDDGSVTVAPSGDRIDVCRVSATEFSVLVGDRSVRVAAARENGEITAFAAGRMYAPIVESERERMLRKFARETGETSSKKELHAPMPALVVRLEVAVGDDVKPGQGLIVLEAMKMENELKASMGGRVKEVYVTAGKPVEKGELLLVIE